MDDAAPAELGVPHRVAAREAGAVGVAAGDEGRLRLDHRRPGAQAAGLHLGLGAPPAGTVIGAGEVGLRPAVLGETRAAGEAAADALFQLHRARRQFRDEARGDRALPQAVGAAVGGVGDLHPLLAARDADIGEAALLLQPGEAVLVHRALRGEKPFLPAGQEDGVELQPLRAMQGHDRNLIAGLVLLGLHDQRDMLQEPGEVLEALHRADEFLEIVETAFGFHRFVGLPHLDIARLLQHQRREIGVGQARHRRPPAVEAVHQLAQAGARLAGHLVAGGKVARRDAQRHAHAPRRHLHVLHRLVADAALGLVDDALEGEIVVALRDHAQIGEGVADLLTLVEARTADHPIGQADRDEAFLELAHLVRGAHQDRRRGEALAALLHRFQLVGDLAGFLLGVPDGQHRDRAAARRLGVQRLAVPAAVFLDEARGGAEDFGRRAVIALQADHLRARIVALERKDVIDLRAAPAIDRLVVVADAADIVARFGQQLQPLVLGDVGVLILVHQDIDEAAAILLQHVGILAQHLDRGEQQVAEIGGVQLGETLLVGGIEDRPLAGGVAVGLAVRHVGRQPAAILPAVDQRRELARRVALLVEIGGGDDLLDQAQLIVGVEDGEIRFEARQFRMTAQHPRADRMEGAQPLHPLDHAADEQADALLHLARRLVGEGDGEDLSRIGAARIEEVGKPGRQHARLAGAGPGEHQHRTVGGQHRLALLGVQAREVGRLAGHRRRRLAEGVFERLGHAPLLGPPGPPRHAKFARPPPLSPAARIPAATGGSRGRVRRIRR